MEQDLVLFGVIVPALIAFAVSLAPRAAWHGHRRDLPAVESWGPAAAIALAFLLSFSHVAQAGDFGSERWHSLSSALMLAGLAAMLCWWHPPRGGFFLAMSVAFWSLLLLQLPGHDGAASRLATASIGALLAMSIIPACRTPGAVAPVILAAAFLAMSAAALASGHSKVAFMAMACGVLLALLAIPASINRRFVLGPAAAGVAASALVACAVFGSAYVDVSAERHAWWWWAAALAPGLSVAPYLLGIAKDRPCARMTIAAIVVFIALAPGVVASLERLRAVAAELSQHE